MRGCRVHPAPLHSFPHLLSTYPLYLLPRGDRSHPPTPPTQLGVGCSCGLAIDLDFFFFLQFCGPNEWKIIATMLSRTDADARDKGSMARWGIRNVRAHFFLQVIRARQPPEVTHRQPEVERRDSNRRRAQRRRGERQGSGRARGEMMGGYSGAGGSSGGAAGGSSGADLDLQQAVREAMDEFRAMSWAEAMAFAESRMPRKGVPDVPGVWIHDAPEGGVGWPAQLWEAFSLLRAEPARTLDGFDPLAEGWRYTTYGEVFSQERLDHNMHLNGVQFDLTRISSHLEAQLLDLVRGDRAVDDATPRPLPVLTHLHAYVGNRTTLRGHMDKATSTPSGIYLFQLGHPSTMQMWEPHMRPSILHRPALTSTVMTWEARTGAAPRHLRHGVEGHPTGSLSVIMKGTVEVAPMVAYACALLTLEVHSTHGLRPWVPGPNLQHEMDSAADDRDSQASIRAAHARRARQQRLAQMTPEELEEDAARHLDHLENVARPAAARVRTRTSQIRLGWPALWALTNAQWDHLCGLHRQLIFVRQIWLGWNGTEWTLSEREAWGRYSRGFWKDVNILRNPARTSNIQLPRIAALWAAIQYSIENNDLDLDDTDVDDADTDDTDVDDTDVDDTDMDDTDMDNA